MYSMFVFLLCIILHHRVNTHGSYTGPDRNSKFDLVSDSNTTENPSVPPSNTYSAFDKYINSSEVSKHEVISRKLDGNKNTLDSRLPDGNPSSNVGNMKRVSKVPEIVPIFRSPTRSLTFGPGGIESSEMNALTESPESRVSKTAFKEISNIPVNDKRSSRTKRLLQIESKTSSVRVVISRATRNASAPSPVFQNESEKNYNLEINLDKKRGENGKKDISNLDIDSKDESARRKKEAKEGVTSSGKLSSKYRASDLIVKKTMCTEPNVECVLPQNFYLNDKSSPIELNTIAVNDETLRSDGQLNCDKERSLLDSTGDIIPDVANAGNLITVPEIPEPIRNSHLPPRILHSESFDETKSVELTGDTVSPTNNKISQPLDSYETFQEKVNQIRDVLKELESNDGSEVEEDYDDYDSEDIPAQFKYLSLFEEKYGNGRRTLGSAINDSRNDISIPPGMMANYPDENRVMKVSLNANLNSVPAEEVISLSRIEDIEGAVDTIPYQDVYHFNASDTDYPPGIQARNFPVETPIWLMTKVSGTRMPPTPFSKSNTSGSNRDVIILNEKEEKNMSFENKEDQETRSVGQNPYQLSPLRSANEKLMLAVESLFKQASTDLAQFKTETSNTSSHASNHEHQHYFSDPRDINFNEEKRFMDHMNENHTLSSTEYTERDSVHNSVENSSKSIRMDQQDALTLDSLHPQLQEELKADRISPDELAEPVNTFLYDYEDNSLPEDPDDPAVNQTPLFLDTGETGSQAELAGDKGRGKFEHFSSNDLDSARFTASVSSAQVRLYELYRDQQLSTAQALEHEFANANSDDPSVAAMPLVAFQYQESRCFTGSKEGLCFTSEICKKKGGQIGSNCNFQGLYCCTFTYSCGDMTKERVTYFKSPHHPARPSSGLTCDYDVTIRSDVCAVRIEFEKVNLARKLGGVCDIDQLFILNSIDGPTTGQCGPLSGYATTVAVQGSQVKPLKVALLIQSAAPFYWYIKVIQLSCSHVKNFRAPPQCGRTSLPRSFDLHPVQSPQRKWHRVPRRKQSWAQDKKKVWWRYPEPILNTYYFSATKRHLQALHQARQPRRRIVSGSEAEIGEFPWQVAIALDGMFFCGGALLNEHFVLTAAHCIMTRDTPVSDLVLHLGDHDLLHLNETAHVRRGVRRVLFHSHFHPFVLSNDIALLQLDRPVAFSNTIQPVCLPQRGESFIGKRGAVVGWGITSFPMGQPSPTLQKLEVKVLSNARCARVIEESIGIGMLCAAPDETQGTCFGDSGGPLTFTQDSGLHVLAGIVSYGVTGCAIMPAYPDLYTRVSEYLRWISVNAIVTK